MFDVAVIGAGTTGVAITLDLLKRGFSVVLLERNAGFGLETNAKSLGLIQGGLTYLKSDRKLVEAASLDVCLLRHLFPDLLKKQEFTIPIFDWSKHPLWQWDGYLSEYDRIAGARMLPLHSILSKQETLEKLPGINQNVKGGAVFYEWVVEPVKFLQTIYLRTLNDKLKKNLTIATGQKVCGFTKNDKGKITTIHCTIAHGKYFWPARFVVNASGPWSPGIAKLLGIHFMLRPTKGTSIFIQGTPFESGIISFDKKGKYIAILPLPEENKILVGPTNSNISQEIYEDPDKASPSREDSIELLETLNKINRRQYTLKDIVGAQCGLRPQLCHVGVKPENISHDFAILDHKWDEIPNFCSVVGGKLSVLLRMAKETGDFVEKKFGRVPSWRLPDLQDCDTETRKFIMTGYGKKFARNHWWVNGFTIINFWAKICLIIPVLKAFLRRKTRNNDKTKSILRIEK